MRAEQLTITNTRGMSLVELSAVNAKRLAQGNRLYDPAGRDSKMFGCAAACPPEHAGRMGVINQQRRAVWKEAQVFIKRGDFAAVREQSVGDQDEFRRAPGALDGPRGGSGIAVLEDPHRAIEEFRGVEQGAVSAFVDERVGEFPGERLGNGQIGHVAVRGQHGGRGAEETGQFFFELAEEHVIAGGFS